MTNLGKLLREAMNRPDWMREARIYWRCQEAEEEIRRMAQEARDRVDEILGIPPAF